MGEGEEVRRNFSVKMLLRLTSGSWEGIARWRHRGRARTRRGQRLGRECRKHRVRRKTVSLWQRRKGTHLKDISKDRVIKSYRHLEFRPLRR